MDTGDNKSAGGVQRQMSRKRQRAAWMMCTIMVVSYMFNTFHAVAMGALRQEILEEFAFSEGQYVQLTNVFSCMYMIMQIPAGILLDKIGPRWIAGMGNLITSAGTVLFAAGSNYSMLLLGRCLIGLGCSVCFLAALKICSQWFEEKIFCTMSGVVSLIGMAGAAAAQTPLAFLCGIRSRRSIFMIIAAANAVMVPLILGIVKDTPAQMGFPPVCKAPKSEETQAIGRAVLSVVKNKWTWPPLISYGCFYGTYLLMTGLYGTSMVQQFYNCTSVKASSCIAMAVFGCAVGCMAIGALSDRLRNRKTTQLAAGGLYLLVWIFLWNGIGKIHLPALYPVMFFLGFFSCAYAVCWSCVKECNDPAYVGISTSIANAGGYLGGIMVPALLGSIYSGNPGNGGAGFKAVLLGAVGICLVGEVSALLVKETGGAHERRA